MTPQGVRLPGKRLPSDRDPESSHGADLRVLLVLQGVVLAQHLDGLSRLDGAAEDPAESVELHPVLRAVHLSGVAHQRALQGEGLWLTEEQLQHEQSGCLAKVKQMSEKLAKENANGCPFHRLPFCKYSEEDTRRLKRNPVSQLGQPPFSGLSGMEACDLGSRHVVIH